MGSLRVQARSLLDGASIAWGPSFDQPDPPPCLNNGLSRALGRLPSPRKATSTAQQTVPLKPENYMPRTRNLRRNVEQGAITPEFLGAIAHFSVGISFGSTLKSNKHTINDSFRGSNPFLETPSDQGNARHANKQKTRRLHEEIRPLSMCPNRDPHNGSVARRTQKYQVNLLET